MYSTESSDLITTVIVLQLVIIFGIIGICLIGMSVVKYVINDHYEKLHQSLLLIIKNQKTMSEQLEAIKAKLNAQSATLDTVSTNVTGIAGDVTALKEKIASLTNGATAEEIAELSTLVDGVGAKVDAIGTATADLDAQTDSTNV